MAPSLPAAFTLLEVLVVISIVTLLLAVLLPGLSRARRQAAAVSCSSNIRQLASANGMYASDHGGRLVPGAPRIESQNLHRWHGVRATPKSDFDAARGPLVPYLGTDRGIRHCPDFDPERRGFEAGNGGYGYNNAYLGVETIANRDGRTIITTNLIGAWADRIARPGETLMFADSAFAADALIEYSFAEPRFHPQWGTRADPSIHFRHQGSANVAWSDGHVTPERRTFSWSSGLYSGDPEGLGIGWFGTADDNSFFDLR
jgi:prepilin-type processing-associated H-X9-DG protein/prepilin-type N-terminal cleavage/methylation domain-containing protein